MSETAQSQPVTMQEAFDRFYEERVLGDKPFAAADGGCFYSHGFNGGCAIGCLLPADLASELDESGLSLAQLRDEGPLTSEHLADLRSPFWGLLQGAHDAMGLMIRDSSYSFAGDWSLFVRSLMDAADIAYPKVSR